MNDCLILGGGVIGLSLAYELAGHGVKVQVIDRGTPGQESSWAGAGILQAAAARADAHPYEQLAGLSNELQGAWAVHLREETGIDNGYRQCGGIYLARDVKATRDLRAAGQHCREQRLTVEELDSQSLAQREPALNASAFPNALLLPQEAQLRNPRHLKALLAACLHRGVTITPGVEAEDFVVRGHRVEGVRTVEGLLSAEVVCIASGAWSRAVAARLGVTVAVKPVRGQMVLLAAQPRLLHRVINEGPRYLVPRDDGRVLIGSTEEDTGFEKRTTGEGVQRLLSFALDLCPALATARFERCWAGLRPGSADGLPYLGRLPNFENAYIAAGHFRSGLQFSVGTAVLMSQLIRGQKPQIDLTPFRPDRSAT
jgi:glycine oxidase